MLSPRLPLRQFGGWSENLQQTSEDPEATIGANRGLHLVLL